MVVLVYLLANFFAPELLHHNFNSVAHRIKYQVSDRKVVVLMLVMDVTPLSPRKKTL